jgi:hypothetical protein
MTLSRTRVAVLALEISLERGYIVIDFEVEGTYRAPRPKRKASMVFIPNPF